MMCYVSSKGLHASKAFRHEPLLFGSLSLRDVTENALDTTNLFFLCIKKRDLNQLRVKFLPMRGSQGSLDFCSFPRAKNLSLFSMKRFCILIDE